MGKLYFFAEYLLFIFFDCESRLDDRQRVAEVTVAEVTIADKGTYNLVNTPSAQLIVTCGN